MYVIAIHSTDFDGKPYRTRYWGDGNDTFTWDNIEDAVAYADNIDGTWFADKRCVIDDVTVEQVDDIAGSTITPTWSSPDENPRTMHTNGSPFVGTTEGYPDEPDYEEEA